MEIEVGEFHTHDGWLWKRLADGSVRVRSVVWAPYSDATRGQIERVLAEHILPASQWASVVAHVSARGETADTFQAAERFHQEG